MFIDMGQADTSLYRKPGALKQSVVCWTRALSIAAIDMGHIHYMDVPDADIESLHAQARRIMHGG